MADEKISTINGGVKSAPASGDRIPAARGAANVLLDPADIAAMGGASAPSDFQPAIVTGNYYYGRGFYPDTSGTPPANSLFAWPIWFSHTETWTRIGINIVTAVAATNMRLGIYSSDASNQPGSLLLDAGEISMATTGDKELTISQELQANTVYWLACVHNDASEAVAFYSCKFTSIRDINNRLGLTTSILPFGWERAFTYDALPASWGTSENLGYNVPAIWLRKV